MQVATAPPRKISQHPVNDFGDLLIDNLQSRRRRMSSAVRVLSIEKVGIWNRPCKSQFAILDTDSQISITRHPVAWVRQLIQQFIELLEAVRVQYRISWCRAYIGCLPTGLQAGLPTSW